MDMATEVDVLSRNDTVPTVPVESKIPAASVNTLLVTVEEASVSSGNTLSIQYRVPADVRGVSRETAVSFLAQALFGSADETVLVVDGLPFHGSGADFRQAREDLVTMLEETLEELETDVTAGVELSAHLQGALIFARHVFGVKTDEPC